MVVISTVPVLRGRRRLGMAYCWGRSARMKTFANLYKRKARNNKEERLRDKKMKKMLVMNRGGNGDNISNNLSSCHSLLDDNMMMCEVLKRLPVKSLMRFKSVCKRWMSLIQHDPYFHDLHLMQSKTRPGLFIITPIFDYLMYDTRISGISGHREFLLSVNFLEGRAAVHTSRKTSPDYIGSTLKPVNGLICSVYSYCERDSVCFYNPSTREVTPWIKNRIKERKEEEQGGEVANQLYFPLYEFGFDPVTKEHKVICVCHIFTPNNLSNYDPVHSVACEILTVGDNSWRSIDDVPPLDLGHIRSVYANGSIYWCKNKVERDEGDDHVIVAFDVGSEKFRVFTAPNSIVIGDLLEVDGHLALVGRKDACTVQMWIYDDDYGNKDNISRTTTNSASNGNWTEVIIQLPFHWNIDVRLSFHAIAGMDQIILHYRKEPASLYSYNWKKKTFKKVEIIGAPLSIPDLASPSLFVPFVESLLPVQK